MNNDQIKQFGEALMLGTHNDVHDERPRQDDYTLEPDMIDRLGNRHPDYAAYEAEQERQKPIINTDEEPF